VLAGVRVLAPVIASDLRVPIARASLFIAPGYPPTRSPAARLGVRHLLSALDHDS
jgi:hypothetical protein